MRSYDYKKLIQACDLFVNNIFTNNINKKTLPEIADLIIKWVYIRIYG